MKRLDTMTTLSDKSGSAKQPATIRRLFSDAGCGVQNGVCERVPIGEADW